MLTESARKVLSSRRAAATSTYLPAHEQEGRKKSPKTFCGLAFSVADLKVLDCSDAQPDVCCHLFCRSRRHIGLRNGAHRFTTDHCGESDAASTHQGQHQYMGRARRTH